jgi:hypothetical protein
MTTGHATASALRSVNKWGGGGKMSVFARRLSRLRISLPGKSKRFPGIPVADSVAIGDHPGLLAVQGGERRRVSRLAAPRTEMAPRGSFVPLGKLP